MAFQPSADSFGIRRFGFKSSWHPSQSNDAVALNLACLAKITIITVFFRVAVNSYFGV